MNKILAMALKDIKLIVRDRMGLFFIVGFPILMGVFFGLVMGGPSSGGGSGKMKVAIVDQDNSDVSKRFVESLKANESLQLDSAQLEEARESVRKGQRVGVIILPSGFGEQAGVFWGDPPTIGLGLDPSKSAESAMLEGFIMQGIGGLVGDRFQDPGQFRPFLDQSRQQMEDAEDMSTIQKTLLGGFLDSVDTMIDSADAMQESEASDGQAAAASMQFANIEPIDLSRRVDPASPRGQLSKLRSSWDISFPQAMLWGVLGCVASFAISIARERTLGTLLRLEVAPINKSYILAGKALACFLTVIAVVAMLSVLGVMLGMRPYSYPKLIAAGVCIAFAFVGIMMVISVLGKSEQSVSGAGWASNMVMAMLGGCMIPAMFMPEFLQKLSVISPVKWAILAIEGAIWREFSWAEMMFPLVVLLAVGALGFVIGRTILNRRPA